MTARNVIATELYLHDRRMLSHEEADEMAARILNAIKESDSVRVELAAMLNPWRPIETAPKTNQKPIILYWRGRRPMEGFWYGIDGHGWYASGPITPSGEPVGWLPLPAPPSEEKE